MTRLVLLDFAAEQRDHVARVGSHLHRYLQREGSATAGQLAYEAERYIPGDSCLALDSVVTKAIEWAVQRGDWRRTQRGARCLPLWAIGPFELTDERGRRRFASRLHGAVPEHISGSTFKVQSVPVVGESGVGVGRVVHAIADSAAELKSALVAAGVQLNEWPVAHRLLMNRWHDLPRQEFPGLPAASLSHMRIGKPFGTYAWSTERARTAARGVARQLIRGAKGFESRFYLTEGGEPVAVLAGAEVVVRAWRAHLARGVPMASEIVEVTRESVVFHSRTIPPMLVQTLRPFDVGPNTSNFAREFALPRGVADAVTPLVQSFVEKLASE